MRQNIVTAAKSKDPESSSDAPTPDLGFRTRAPARQFGLLIPRTQQEDPRDGSRTLEPRSAPLWGLLEGGADRWTAKRDPQKEGEANWSSIGGEEGRAPRGSNSRRLWEEEEEEDGESGEAARGIRANPWIAGRSASDVTRKGSYRSYSSLYTCLAGPSSIYFRFKINKYIFLFACL